MTVARGVRIDVRRTLAIAVMGLVGAVGTLVLMLWLAGSTSLVEVKLGDTDFRGMDAARLSANQRRTDLPGPVGRCLVGLRGLL